MARLRQALPEMKVEPVRQLVEGESRIVDRTHALMYGAVLLIALTVAVSVLATLSASVLERRRDFALMKALGGSQAQLMGMFLLEAVVLALAGVAAGFVVGRRRRGGLVEVNFHTASLPRLQVLPMVLVVECGDCGAGVGVSCSRVAWLAACGIVEGGMRMKGREIVMDNRSTWRRGLIAR